ncbi:hypothetical protein ES705_23159 [subsurface metagenome]
MSSTPDPSVKPLIAAILAAYFALSLLSGSVFLSLPEAASSALLTGKFCLSKLCVFF